jgi:hypothetical protein
MGLNRNGDQDALLATQAGDYRQWLGLLKRRFRQVDILGQ